MSNGSITVHEGVVGSEDAYEIEERRSGYAYCRHTPCILQQRHTDKRPHF